MQWVGEEGRFPDDDSFKPVLITKGWAASAADNAKATSDSTPRRRSARRQNKGASASLSVTAAEHVYGIIMEHVLSA